MPPKQFKQSTGIAVLHKGFKRTEDLDLFPRDGRTSRSPFLGRRFCQERRCVAQVVSLTLGDALNNSRWWFTSHRRSLYSDEDHLQPATSSALLDQGDEFKEEINSRRLIRQQLLEKFPAYCTLLLESYRDTVDAK